jgi:ATP-dependent helicase/nuclease subunit B
MARIINIGIQENFIKALGDLVEKDYISKGRDLSRLAFVFGGKRPSLFLKRELAGRMNKAFASPAFFAMDEFIDTIVSSEDDFEKINELDAAYLLYSLAREKSPQILKGKESFSSFLPWAREILAFIEQLDLEDIESKVLKTIELNAAIGFDVPESINALLTKIISLRSDFHRELKLRNSYTRGMSYLRAGAVAGKSKYPDFDEIWFCNLFYLHGSEKKVISGFYKNNRAALVFQGEAGKFSVLKDLEQEFDCKIGSGAGAVAPKISFYSCFDSVSQAGMVRNILQGIKDQDQTVIVLPEPGKVIVLLSEISSIVDEFNVSMGYPLKRTPLFSLFKAVFKAQGSQKSGRYYSPDYLSVLSHPLIKNLKIFPDAGSTRILVHKIEEFLIGMEKSALGGSIFIEPDEIESLKQLYDKTLILMEKTQNPLSQEEVKLALRRLHELLFHSWEAVATFSDFAKVLSAFSEFLLKKSFLENYPLNLKMIQRIIEIGNELEFSHFSREPFSKEEIFKIFIDALENELVSFSGSPLKGLQILGLIETRSLNFKNVIIMDVNESALPDLKVNEPLIPREVMLNLGLNRLEKEEEIQRYQFDRLISHAQNVFLIFEEGRDKERSRFIEDLIWKKQKDESKLEIGPVPRASFKVEVLPKKGEIKKDSRIIGYLRSFDYSATNINTYLRCPLRFYFRYVLNLEEKVSLLEEPQGAQIGNFIHGLLEETFKKFLGKKTSINGVFRKYFFARFDQMFDETFLRTMKSDSFLLKEILRYRLERFLALEGIREVSEVLMLEAKFKEEIRLSGNAYNFVMKVDRIDRLSDNSLLVIDYKTGASELKPKSIEKIREYGFERIPLKDTIGSFQMPLYLYFVRRLRKENVPINAALYNLRTASLDYFLKPGDYSRIDEIEEIFIGAAGSLIREINDPKVNFVSDEQDSRYCQNCPFFNLCR